MNNVSMNKTHPLIVIAATAVILTCLLAIGVMTGIIPSPLNRSADREEVVTTTPNPNSLTSSPTASSLRDSPSGTTTTTRESRTVTRAPAPEPRRLTEQRQAAPRASTSASSSATGASSSPAPSRTVAGTSPAPAAPAPCTNCGTVTSVRAVTQQSDAGMIGPAAGALLGGLAGNQIGGGSGKTIATVVGAGAGAAAGTEIERRYKSTTSYVVAVRMNDGSSRSFNYASAPGVQAGSKVRVVDGQLVHD